MHRYADAHEQFVALSGRVIFRKYADVVRRVAREQGVPLIDLTAEFTSITDEMLYVDDMHPSEHGQQLISAKLAENWPMIERGVVMGVE